MLKHPTLFAGLLPVATLAVALTIAPTPASATSAAVCTSAWNDCSARHNCTLDNIAWDNSRNKCGISARCSPRNNQTNNIYATVDDTKRLHNCNGQLRVGGCGTTQTCTDAWNKSSARHSCDLDNIAWDSSQSKCSIKADCKTGEFDPLKGYAVIKSNHVYVTEDDAEDLSNCAGDLVVGSC